MVVLYDLSVPGHGGKPHEGLVLRLVAERLPSIPPRAAQSARGVGEATILHLNPAPTPLLLLTILLVLTILILEEGRLAAWLTLEA